MKYKNTDISLNTLLKKAENHMYRHKIGDGISKRNQSIAAIWETLTIKYVNEKNHSENVQNFSYAIGVELGLNEFQLNELKLAGLFHDIGKISIPDSILMKEGRLTNEEYSTIKSHTEVGYQILRAADQYSELAIHALCHHERWDGKGYPKGLKGEEIPLFSRIICIADSYDAMTSVRTYKDKMSKSDACKEIIACSGTQFDERIAKVFVEKVLNFKWE